MEDETESSGWIFFWMCVTGLVGCTVLITSQWLGWPFQFHDVVK